MRILVVGLSLAFGSISSDAIAEDQGLYLFETYRPDADPAADLELAKARATAQGKRILIEVGGDWCIWCHILDRYLQDNADVTAAYEDAFVVIKVNWARDDLRNEAFLSQYPERGGYPHFYILDADGSFLASQNTVELEDGGESYDKAAMLAFARRWVRPGA
jgi:thiol:disulfide interchange protein